MQVGAVKRIPAGAVGIVIGDAGKALRFCREAEVRTIGGPAPEGAVKFDTDDRLLAVDADRQRRDGAFQRCVADCLELVKVRAFLCCRHSVARDRLPFAAVNAVLVFVNAGERRAFERDLHVVCNPGAVRIDFVIE